MLSLLPCSRLIAQLGVAALSASLLAGCSSHDDAGCANWERVPLQRPAGYTTDTFGALAWADGVLYGTTAGVQGAILFAMPNGDGVMREVVHDYAYELWVDGHFLFYTHEDQVLSVAVTGGFPLVVVDGQVAPLFNSPSVWQRLYDGESLYMLVWDEHAGAAPPYSLLRKRRSGGNTEVLATFPDYPRASVTYAATNGGLALFGDDVVVAFDEGHAFAVPKSAGTARPLDVVAQATSFLGFDDVGPLWRVEATDGATYSIGRASVSAPALGQPFWSAMSPKFWPYAVWPLTSSSSIVFGDEHADGADDVAAWAIDASPRRLGCTAIAARIGAVAVSPDAIFVAADISENLKGGSDWVLERIPR